MAENEKVDTSKIEAQISSLEQALSQILAELSSISSLLSRTLE
jgi:hypothetical protein